MTPNIEKIKELIASKENILINDKFIKKILCFSDVRDFLKEIENWGYVSDFTARTEPNNWQLFLRSWLKETYLD